MLDKDDIKDLIAVLNNGSTNMELPDFDRSVPHSFFELFEIFMNTNQVTDAETKLAHMIRKIPTDILLILQPILSGTLQPDVKLKEVKAQTLKHLQKDASKMLDYYLAYQKRPDMDYSAFLRTLKSIAKTCDKTSDQKLLQNRFMASVKDDLHLSLARTMLIKDDLEEVARALDNLPIRKEVYALATTDNSKLENLTILVEKLAERIENLTRENHAPQDSRERQKFTIDQNRQQNNYKANSFGMHQQRHTQQQHAYQRPTQQQQPAHSSQQQTHNSNSRWNYAQRNYTPHSNNLHANTPRGNNGTVCYYHNRFGSNARKCDPQCKFFRKN